MTTYSDYPRNPQRVCTTSIPFSQDELRDLLDYAPETGLFTWKVASAARRVGARAGCRSTDCRSKRYIVIGIKRRKYPAHRLAFVWMGVPLPCIIDHVDGDGENNRWANLRAATYAENAWNTGATKTNTTGFKGAHFARRGCYTSAIRVNGQDIYLGRFSDPEAAHAAYVEAATKYHGEFARAK